MSAGQDDQSFHERVQALFLAAVEQPAERRAAWLEQACAGDRRLADEVASLLVHHRPQQTLVEPLAGPARLLVVRDVAVPAWTGPRRMLAAALVLLAALGAGGVLVQDQVQEALDRSLEDHLVSLRDAGVTGLEVWMREVMINAEVIATDPAVVTDALALVQDDDGSREFETQRDSLRERLDLLCRLHHWRGWALVRLSDDPKVVAVGGADVSPEGAVGRSLNTEAREQLAQLVRPTTPDTRVVPPHAQGSFLEGDPGNGPPVVTLGAVVRHDGQAIAALAFQISPEDAFTRILRSMGPGQGETVAFDEHGRLLSHTIHEEELRAAGVLGAGSAMLNLELRDPGVDLLAGERLKEPLDVRPMTAAVRYALAGRHDRPLEPYRSYTGQMVVGAWTWLKDHDFGVVTEIPVEQAYAPLLPWRRVLIGLWSVLGLIALAMLALTIAIRRLRQRVEELAELGSYHLERPLGAGGMGAVYLARHALLRRPTAVKVLRPDQASDELVRRFEEEVQQTSQLSHPNTIEIYDYGRTPERVFYYAMEYADGLDLSRLVEREGRLPAARAVHLLRQLCGSLAEAHARGLVHRDIKPQNVLVCQRGGLFDFVKVLDFGLVKEVGVTPPPGTDTAPGLLLGTLLYMPPERLRGETAVGPRGDVYALGATAYKLLTGRDVHTGATTAELCANILSQPPQPPSSNGAPEVPPALETLVLTCLSKQPEQRPADAGAVLAALDALAGLPRWSQAEARAWWERFAGTRTDARH